MIKVIIVDDHALFRIGIKSALQSKQSDICVVGEAGDGKTLFHLLGTTPTDLVLLDLILPDMNGIEIARRIKEEYPHLKILLISVENTADIIIQLLTIGINGFISKQLTTGEDLPEAIHSVMSGMEYFGKDIATIIYNVYNAKKNVVGTKVEFTPREQEIVAMAGKGLQSKEIASQLFISARTVETHKNNIFKKLGINSSAELIQYVFKHKIISF